MGQIIGPETITKLSKISTTKARLLGLSIVTVKTAQISLLNAEIDTSLSGLGGIDTGAIAASSFYYVYAVKSGSQKGLAASLSEVKPVGFSQYRKVGSFYTDGASDIFKVYYQNEKNKKTLTARFNHAGAVVTLLSQTQPNFISGFSRAGNGQVIINPDASNFSVIPAIKGSAGTLSRQFAYANGTITLVSVFIETSEATGSEEDNPFSVDFVKQGIDSVEPDWNLY